MKILKKIIDELNKKIDELSQKESPNENPPKDPPNNDDRNPENSVPSNDNKGHNNLNIDSLPDGPAKQSLIEEQEQKEFEKHQENGNNKDPGNSENKDSEKTTESNEGNNVNNKDNSENSIIPKSMKTHYYQVLKNFNKYDASFFIGSDILFGSSRMILKKDSSEILYVLLKLIIPDPLNKTPMAWSSFLLDSRELKSEAEYNALSRGDSS